MLHNRALGLSFPVCVPEIFRDKTGDCLLVLRNTDALKSLYAT